MHAQIFRTRVESLRRSLRDGGFDGGMLVPGPNLRYFTGIHSLLLERPFMLFVPAEGIPHLLAPRLEAGPYASCPVEMEIHQWTDSEGWDRAYRDLTRGLKVRGRWGVEGRVPYLFVYRLLKHSTPTLEDAEPILQGLREVKDAEEIILLKKASVLLGDSFKEFPGVLKEGVTELELARKATEIIYSKGATRVEDVLVQSGERGADPHGLPSSRKLRRGEGIIFDISCEYEGYYADITRTLCLGASRELADVYSKVLDAEVAGIRAGAAGVEVGEVDLAARNRLAKAGLGKYFIHRTGHGLGLEVHEAPYIVEGGKEKLRDGMCYTVEPGAYLRGKLGVRIEDDVLMEKGRAKEITTPPKEYGWWA